MFADETKVENKYSYRKRRWKFILSIVSRFCISLSFNTNTLQNCIAERKIFSDIAVGISTSCIASTKFSFFKSSCNLFVILLFHNRD